MKKLEYSENIPCSTDIIFGHAYPNLTIQSNSKFMNYFKKLAFTFFILFSFAFFTSCEEDSTDDMVDDQENTDDNNENNSEGPSELSIVIPFAGTYNVINDTESLHSRGTITIGSDGSVDFDTDISFSAADAQAVYDRIECCHRIQISYGADDDGEVINLYLNDTDDAVTSIQFRHRTATIDTTVEVEKL